MADQASKVASGADLARQALAAYKSAARPGAQPKARSRARRADRGSGRDPVGLGALLGRISTEQSWEASLSAGSITDQWADLCPQYVGHIEPVHYDPERRVLDLRPCSPAYATQLRLLGGQLARQINDKLGSVVVRAIRALPVGTVAAAPPDLTTSAPGTACPPGPVKTRETASAGYQQARAAIRPTAPSGIDPRIVDAMRRQVRDRLQEPEHSFREAAIAREEADETAAAKCPDTLLASIQAALDYKYRSQPLVRRAFDAS